jgi:hypothetical protein
MKTLLWAVGLAMLVTLAAVAQDPQTSEQDRTAVRQAAHDYAEGYFDGAPDRMQQAVHPAIVKRGVATVPGVGAFLSPMNAETLVESTRQGRGKLPAEKRGISFALLDIRDHVASARIFTAQFHDYLHLIKQDGRWRIASVLWQPPNASAVANADADKAAVAQVVKEFFDKSAAFDAARVEQLLHPEAAFRRVMPSVPPGRFFLMEGNRDGVTIGVRTKRMPPFPNPSTTVLDVYDTIASAMTTTPAASIYWHLVKQEGQWRIVNALVF